MTDWYTAGKYCLTENDKYSATKVYLALLETDPKDPTSELVWTRVALPKY